MPQMHPSSRLADDAPTDHPLLDIMIPVLGSRSSGPGTFRRGLNINRIVKLVSYNLVDR